MQFSTKELFDILDALDTAIEADYVVYTADKDAWRLLREKIRKALRTGKRLKV